jgi:hypothetical protein
MDDLERAVQISAFMRYLGVLCLGLGSCFAFLTIYPPIAEALAGKRVNPPPLRICRTTVC